MSYNIQRKQLQSPLSASYADSASVANLANLANLANTANTATYATTAGNANSADYAGTAGTSTFSDLVKVTGFNPLVLDDTPNFFTVENGIDGTESYESLYEASLFSYQALSNIYSFGVDNFNKVAPKIRVLGQGGNDKADFYIDGNITATGIIAGGSIFNGVGTLYFSTDMLRPTESIATALSYNTSSNSLYLHSGSFGGSLIGTASWANNAVTASHLLGYISPFPFTGSALISGSLVVVGDVTVFGSSSLINITASQLNVGDNTISVNVFEPAQRFGGLLVYDSGSLSHQATASLLWDSQNNHWIYQNASGSSYTGGGLISGPKNFGALGNETYPTLNRIVKGEGGDHITDSNISDNGSVVSINSNTEVTGSLKVTNSYLQVSTPSGQAISITTQNLGSFVDMYGQNGFIQLAQDVLLPGDIGLFDNYGYPMASWIKNTNSNYYSQGNYFYSASRHTFINPVNFTNGASGSFTGSFSGSGANLSDIPASGITGLNLSRIATGSVTASVDTGAGTFSVVSGSSTFLFVSSSGNVGIGTTTPTVPFQVQGASLFNENITTGTDGSVVGKGIILSALGSNLSNLIYSRQILNNRSHLVITPATGTSVQPNVNIVPKGAGVTGQGAVLRLYTADAYTSGQPSDFGIISAFSSYIHFGSATQGGTGGANRPILLSAGATSTTPINTNQMWLYTTGNVGINTSVDAGFLLDVSGSTRISGEIFSGNYSGSQTSRVKLKGTTAGASTAFYIIGEHGTISAAQFSIREDGVASFVRVIASTGFIDSIEPNSSGTTLILKPFNGATYGVSLQNGFDYSHTAGTRSTFRIGQGFAPTSGTGNYNGIIIDNAISQSGGANGTSRGIQINPTLTSAPDWRSIEWNNNTGFGLYGSGSSQNLLRGNLHIGSFTTSSNTLSVAGTGQFTGNLTLSGSAALITSTINSNVVGGDITFGNRILFNSFAGTGGGGTVSLSNGSRLSFLSGGPQSNFTRLDLNTLLQNSTAGTAASVGFADYVTINLTGTANDTCTSYLASPTLTSLGSGSYRAFVWTNNSGFGLLGSGSAQNILRGNLHIGSLVTASNTLSVAGTTRLSGSFNTATSGSILTVIGSGSAQPIFTVQGSQGELFSVVDSLSGSLFSVNDVSGLPIMEVFSDNSIVMGNYLDPMLITTVFTGSVASGSHILYRLPTSSYDGFWFDYTVRSGSNARAGQMMGIWSGSAVNYTETTTTDFGTTTGINLMSTITGSNMIISASTATSGWTIKGIVRAI